MNQLRRIKDLTRLKLQSADGEFGTIDELYFDDRSWAVRYLVVKTGGWLLGRKVLVAPVAVQHIDYVNGIISVRLTKEQIEQSPPIDSAKPVSREIEEAYYRHFQWAPYWQPGPTTWGSSVPYPGVPPLTIDTPVLDHPLEHPHLRSSIEVTGYDIHARDGEIGHVEDLVIDDEDWLVRYVEVDSNIWLPGKKVLVQTAHVDHISWADHSVNVLVTRGTIESAPAYDPSQLITPQYEVKLFMHYGRRPLAA